MTMVDDQNLSDPLSGFKKPGFKKLRKWRVRFREPLLTVLLAIQILSLFVMPTLRAAGLGVPRFISVGTFLIFVGLAIFLSRSRGAMTMLAISVVLTVVGGLWHREQPNFLTDVVSAMGQVFTQLSLLWVVATAVFGPGRTTHHRILGAIVMYLSIGMAFTSLYVLLAQAVKSPFTHLPTDSFDLRETLTYFSFSTLTTGSFGDILPVHPMARSLANLEAICGQLFPATLLARIVSLHSAGKTETDQAPPQQGL